MTEKSKDSEISILRQKLTKMSELLDAERASKKTTKNIDFVQVSRAELRAIADLGAKNTLALDLLMILTQSMNKQNAVVISFKAMQQIVGKSRPTIDRAIRLLREDNWLQVIKIGTSNAYVLNSAVFWTDRGNKKYTTNFNAQIITTLDEQDKDLRKNPNVKLRRIPSVVNKHERVTLGNDKLPPPDQQDLDLD